MNPKNHSVRKKLAKEGARWETWIQSHRYIIVKKNLEYYGQLQELVKKLSN